MLLLLLLLLLDQSDGVLKTQCSYKFLQKIKCYEKILTHYSILTISNVSSINSPTPGIPPCLHLVMFILWIWLKDIYMAEIWWELIGEGPRGYSQYPWWGQGGCHIFSWVENLHPLYMYFVGSRHLSQIFLGLKKYACFGGFTQLQVKFLQGSADQKTIQNFELIFFSSVWVLEKYSYIIIWQGKSERSDWFFLGRDFTIRTVSTETVQAVYFFSFHECRQIKENM